MNRDEILLRVTDALSGELDREEKVQLQAALAADPALAAEARELEMAWQRIESLSKVGQPEQAVLTRVFGRIVKQGHAELSDEELDKAAGGIGVLRVQGPGNAGGQGNE